MSELYLIWSLEHSAWRGPRGAGYTRRQSEAEQYTRAEAIDICTEAMPGTTRLGALPELPVAVADLKEMNGRYFEERGPRAEPWQ